ncbi:putative dimethyladenosine transferase [Candidatus Zinderia insecticola CARI]|uniref:Putative dimethyladenosine transferase n=1 Tax=Zinderia insecticola (strain CARI) TaxID=871271 RepID=E0TJ17_ZINIC|nr:putative dimethyladenosine transferase [Candidatus Zinderia insecticola CARI]
MKIKKNKFSQIFLINNNLIKKIIKKINIKNNDFILEIGFGNGNLTKYLIKYKIFLFAIEIDKKLYKNLKIKYKNKINLFNYNILKFNIKIFNKKFRIIGNLPYNISKKIILYFIKFYKNIKDIYVMLQKEFVKKINANYGNKKFSKISILTQIKFNIIILLNISKKNFYPIPKVNSYFIKMIPKKYIYYNKSILNLILKISFFKKKKIIKNSMKKIFNLNNFNFLNINFNFKAKDLSIKNYLKLTNLLEKKLNL